MSEPRLTPQQRARVAVAVLCDQIEQHKVAALMGVNPGRVNEAVQAARTAFEFPEKKKERRLKVVA